MGSEDNSLAGSSVTYVGFWTDFDRGGKVLGATLTLRNRDAAILLAFLAVLVGISANRSWKIWRFFLHSLLSVDNRSRPSGRGQQRLHVILRNTETAASTLASLVMLPINAMQRLERTDYVKLLLLSGFALLHLVGFVAAGILTSQLFLGRDVTSKSLENCGQWGPKKSSNTLSSTEITLAFQELQFNQTIDADNYVRNCYPQGVSRDILDCGTLMKRYLPSQIKSNIDCPFDKSVCLNGTKFGVELSSGNISFADLGINTRYSRQLFVQRKTTCAVIAAMPFLNKEYDSSNTPTLNDDEIIFDFSFASDNDTGNWTFSYRFDNFQEGYSLRAYLLDTPSLKLPGPLNIRPTDSALSLLLLSGPNLFFPRIVDDPWFSAHRRLVLNANTTREKVVYRMDDPVNVIACDEQIQYCSTLTGHCNDWTSVNLVQNDEKIDRLGRSLFPKDSEDAISIFSAVGIVGLSAQSTSIAYSVQNRGAAALQASRYFDAGTQFKIAPEQWKVELGYWFSASLARLQLEIFNTIDKPPGVDTEIAENTWSTGTDIRSICGRVKYRSVSHTSISVVGLLVIVCMSAFFMIVSFMDFPATLLLRKWEFIRRWVETENLALLGVIEKLDANKEEESTEGQVSGVFHQSPDKALD